VWVWARTVHLEKESVAVCVVIPETEGSFAGHLIGTYFGPDAIDLAVGYVDMEGRLCEITPTSEVLVGLGREEIEGSDLASLVHPDDVDRLMTTLAQAAASADEVSLNVRLRHPERGWAEVRCFAFPTDAGQPLRLAFALADATDRDSGSESARFADLERQVLRIAAELHAVNLTHRDPSAPHESRDAALDRLPPRQREIVDRLLRGERIATIAESMYLSPSTVRNHLSKVFRLIGVNSQAELLSLLRSEVGPDR
jgi:PAS domain S-box-containing protein